MIMDKEVKRSPMFCSHYLFEVKTMADAPPGLVAIVGKESYRVVKLCWCTWFSSGDKEALVP